MKKAGPKACSWPENSRGPKTWLNSMPKFSNYQKLYPAWCRWIRTITLYSKSLALLEIFWHNSFRWIFIQQCTVKWIKIHSIHESDLSWKHRRDLPVSSRAIATKQSIIGTFYQVLCWHWNRFLFNWTSSLSGNFVPSIYRRTKA